MKAILFDLDNTIFATQSCNVYLRSRAGRSVICDLIKKEEVKIKPLTPGIVKYINDLNALEYIDVFIISDSPKDYCLTILEKFDVHIDRDKILGSMHKPSIENDEVFSTYNEILVIGDTPKDIYLAHRLKAASIFLTCLTEYDIKYSVDNSMPSVVANSFDDLVTIIGNFLNGNLKYKTPYFKRMFYTVDAETVPIIDIPDDDIGFSMRYIPDLDEIDNENDKFSWFKVHRSIKPAKILSPAELESKKKISFYNNSGKITEGVSFKDTAWFARENFAEWLREKNITGKVYLVAAPASVPRECNKSLPIEIMVYWWLKWLPHLPDMAITLKNGCYVERFWPTTPSHMSKGKREIRPHFHTLGVFKDAEPFDSDTDAIVIVDDVVTSGTQMKAIASLLNATGIIRTETRILGYALAKTTRRSKDIDFSKLLEEFSKAEKAGG
ncbi:hypothetical protein RBA71_05055 [Brenneria goodwinii]|uniref:HAD family hydrolase n=1 Tax=Brenneria goodwinii TaxID=1109412 RepID=UPI0036E7C036